MAEERWLIVGCGYVGAQVALRARQSGIAVHALTRSPSRFVELRELGVEPRLGHWLEPASLAGLPAVDRVLVAIPHRADDASATLPQQSDEVAERTHAIGLQNLLEALPEGWKKLVYLSTTGVYSESTEKWIDEQSPVSPKRIGPRIAVAAEQWLRQSIPEQSYCVLRLAGIYGPGRIPLAERLRRGEPLAVPRHGYLNLVHVTDIASVACELLERSLQHSLYLLSDGQPVLRETFYRHLAQLCGVAEPEFVDPDEQDTKARRATDKRISPARLLAEIGYQLKFPDYRSGLADALGR